MENLASTASFSLERNEIGFWTKNSVFAYRVKTKKDELKYVHNVYLVAFLIPHMRAPLFYGFYSSKNLSFSICLNFLNGDS